MEIKTLDKEKFETLKNLSETNLKVSEAKNIIQKLKKEENDYIIERENQVKEAIDKIYKESSSIFKETLTNFNSSKEIANYISDTVDFLDKAYLSFHLMIEEFNERSLFWNKEKVKHEKNIEDFKKSLVIQKTEIENEKKYIEKQKKQIENDFKHIESQRTQIKIALDLLKAKQK